jgi:hypothetical protein
MNYEYREEGHLYLADGVEWPSITQIVGGVQVVRKDGSVGKWFDYGFMKDAKRDEVMSRGTWVADCAAARINNGAPFPPAVLAQLEAEAPDWFSFYLPFERWLVRALAAGFAPLIVERPLFSPRYRFAGRPDLVCLLNGNRPSIVEIKTGSALDETRVQTAGQEILVNEQDDYPYKGQGHDRYALELTPDGRDAQLIPHRNGARDRSHFLAALTLYQAMHEGYNGNGRNYHH